MRMLSRPRAEGETIVVLSACMKNAPFFTEKTNQDSAKVERKRGRLGNSRTICQAFVHGVSLTDVVDAAVRRVVLGLPVPSLVEVLAYPLIFEKIECPGTWGEG